MTRKYSIRLLVAGAAVMLAAMVGSASAATAPKAGGVLKLNMVSSFSHIDPAIGYDTEIWQVEYSTALKLYNYPDASGVKGAAVVPEAATALPKITNGGRTWVVTVKTGLKFSDGKPVTAANFAYAFDRGLNPQLAAGGPGSYLPGVVAGADQVAAGSASHISGIVVKGNTITFHLIKNTPDFLHRLALPFFQAIEKNMPVATEQTTAYPSAGPYFIASYNQDTGMVVKRNKFYTGSRPHFFNEMDFHFGVPLDQSEQLVEKGQADYAFDGVPPTDYQTLWNTYGPTSKAGKSGHTGFFVNPLVETDYIALNTSSAPFNNVNNRIAVNYALNRTLMKQQRGAYAGALSDQVTPPAMPSFKKINQYPLAAPDLVKANQFGAGLKGQHMTYISTTTGSGPKIAAVVATNIQAAFAGSTVDIQKVDPSVYYDTVGKKGTNGSLYRAGWVSDYPDPGTFYTPLFDGTTITDEHNNNLAYLNDPTVNTQVEKAAGLGGSARLSAYTALDQLLTTKVVPWAVYINQNNRDFFSSRVGGQLFSPLYLMDLNTLHLR